MGDICDDVTRTPTHQHTNEEEEETLKQHQEEEDNTQLVVVNEASRKQHFDQLDFNKSMTIYLHTGNIATWNSLKTRKTQAPANELHHCIQKTLQNWVSEAPEKINYKNSNITETFDGEDERSLIRVTVKILLHKYDLNLLDEAVNETLKSLNINYFDTLILSTPPIESDSETSQYDVILPYWRTMERLHKEGIALNLSSSDLDKEKLEWLVKSAEVKPEINQVNLTSCCHMPVDLVEFAKSNDITLQTHGDSPVMLPDDVTSDTIEDIAAGNGLKWETNWVVRYVVLIKCRGVIKSKGYITAVEGLAT